MWLKDQSLLLWYYPTLYLKSMWKWCMPFYFILLLVEEWHCQNNHIILYILTRRIFQFNEHDHSSLATNWLPNFAKMSFFCYVINKIFFFQLYILVWICASWSPLENEIFLIKILLMITIQIQNVWLKMIFFRSHFILSLIVTCYLITFKMEILCKNFMGQLVMFNLYLSFQVFACIYICFKYMYMNLDLSKF